ncbi:MAG: hypothetical protein LBM04_12785 [Opitutaceae bacterium]|jgi:hypothetical protein|nr:hypothetical protein [Opitutaceae bacterium]
MFGIFFYKFIHITALAILTGYTFYAFAAPAGTRKTVLMITGIMALVMFVSGFALMHKMGYQWHGWVWVKLICWLGLATISGMAWRRRQLAPRLKLAAIGILAIGIHMAVYKPAM